MKHIIIQTVEELYLATTPKSIGIADLGCSSGPNTLSIIKDIFQAIQGTSQRIMHHSTEFRVYFNDLPTNDFNSIFKAIPEFQNLLRQDRKNGFPSIFMGGYPGSFYGRLFPNSYLHFVHSSFSLHWLSRVYYTFPLSCHAHHLPTVLASYRRIINNVFWILILVDTSTSI